MKKLYLVIGSGSQRTFFFLYSTVEPLDVIKVYRPRSPIVETLEALYLIKWSTLLELSLMNVIAVEHGPHAGLVVMK